MQRDLRLTAVGRRYGIRGPSVSRVVDLTVTPGTVTGSQTGRAPVPLLPLSGAALLTAVAFALAGRLTARRSP
ncbi:hypothetical protein ACWDZ8_18405 [Streptomyces sp. NPDC003233]